MDIFLVCKNDLTITNELGMFIKYISFPAWDLDFSESEDRINMSKIISPSV